MASSMATILKRQVSGAAQHLRALAASPALRSPTGYLEQKAKNVQLLKNRLMAAQVQSVERKQRRYVELTAKLDAMSPLKVLTRGYAMAQTETGDVIRSIEQVSNGDRICVNVSDGTISAVVEDRKGNGQ
jgi:exodeoxyribonuclease VII large subunit